MADSIGSIEPGKQADLVCVAMDVIETQPMYQPISQLVYSTGRQQVSDVWIAGERKLRNRALAGLDIAELRATARRWRDRIVAT